MRNIDFSSWQNVVVTLLGLALVTLIGVGIRLVVMSTVQQRRERMNRQINERLRTLIAAYRTLGGSFTGDLSVNPAHLRDLRPPPPVRVPADGDKAAAVLDLTPENAGGSDRARRIRDAVEAALADILLLGTQEHVRLAERAARELVAGHLVHTQELVVSLRAFIRQALDLDPIPPGLDIPMQGPARPSAGPGKGPGKSNDDRQGDKGGDKNGGGMGMGMGGGGGGGFSFGAPEEHEDRA
ncbi:hypothetical protein Y958_08165 [Nitrospirillum viridazoti CBAmc]|uniref:Uncharacterized protein n=2 Tax=Nitrospirillum TaxID=1543705 RepID=A0A248JQ09_9PROT|nr:hypothetical protein [Nitrospirillum amazonense]ASG20787.1 hypothetical protein Y958_08165 [Nitrospirillum amazonense CBAmc]